MLLVGLLLLACTNATPPEDVCASFLTPQARVARCRAGAASHDRLDCSLQACQAVLANEPDTLPPLLAENAANSELFRWRLLPTLDEAGFDAYVGAVERASVDDRRTAYPSWAFVDAGSAEARREWARRLIPLMLQDVGAACDVVPWMQGIRPFDPHAVNIALMDLAFDSGAEHCMRTKAAAALMVNRMNGEYGLSEEDIATYRARYEALYTPEELAAPPPPDDGGEQAIRVYALDGVLRLQPQLSVSLP